DFIVKSLLCIPFEIDWETELFNFTNRNHLWKKLVEIRLHDIYSKNKYQQLALMVLNQIKTFHPSSTYSQDWVTDKKHNLFLNDGFASGNALFDVKYRINPGVCIGIQVQGMSFRLFVDGTEQTQEKAKNIASMLLDERKWFSFHHIPNHESLQIYPTEAGKVFNGYGRIKKTGEQWFFYKSVNLEPLLMKDLVNLVSMYITEVIKLKDLFTN
ncbi:hypothetical protein, partial [Paenibacillus chitinolyticus]|uniref:hypothetical protein n=1 Tax=Paenibacillus chitinolyticus TaxID=79263 RepID=UPI003671D384